MVPQKLYRKTLIKSESSSVGSSSDIRKHPFLKSYEIILKLIFKAIFKNNIGRFTDFVLVSLLSNFQQEFYFVVSPGELGAIFRHVDKNKMAA